MKINNLTLIVAISLFYLSSTNLLFGQEYVIKPNDAVRTYVFDNPDLGVNTTVPPDGMISFPLVGEINVLNMTGDNLAKLLAEKLQTYLIQPKINVFVTAYNPLKVYILGAVGASGAYDYKPGSRLTDYITEAAGFTTNSDLKHCYIYPQDKTQPKVEINLKKLLEKNPNSELDIVLNPFDTVYIKPKSGFMFSEWRDIADALNIVLGMFTLYVILSR